MLVLDRRRVIGWHTRIDGQYTEIMMDSSVCEQVNRGVIIVMIDKCALTSEVRKIRALRWCELADRRAQKAVLLCESSAQFSVSERYEELVSRTCPRCSYEGSCGSGKRPSFEIIMFDHVPRKLRSLVGRGTRISQFHDSDVPPFQIKSHWLCCWHSSSYYHGPPGRLQAYPSSTIGRSISV